MTDSTSTLQASTKVIRGENVVIGKQRWDGFFSLVAVDPSSGWSGLCSFNQVKFKGGRTRVKWAAIKDPTRSIEKMQRVYNRHVSRLVDIVRQSIVFHDLGELTTSLETILQDPKVSFSQWPRHRSRGTLMHCRSHLVACDFEAPCLSPPASC